VGQTLTLLTISIGLDPDLFRVGGLAITWHGLITAAAIVVGVGLGVNLGKRFNYGEDEAYGVAVAGVVGGIIGARALYVMENWKSMDMPWEMFRVAEGGISIWGAIIGGIGCGLAYGLWRRLVPWRGLDVGAMGLILGMAVGRIACLVTGDTFAKSSHLPWAVEYTNVHSPGFGYGPQHPAVAYEMIGDLLILGIIALMVLRFRLKAGYAFASLLILYSLMRFGVSYLRVDSAFVIKDWITVPQFVSVLGLGLGLLTMVVVRLRPASWPEQPDPTLPAVPAGQSGPKPA
jgi:phosphatidylglycerol:prolipoprotein diacylglycerol transferase